jgi:hypothetical protein
VKTKIVEKIVHVGGEEMEEEKERIRQVRRIENNSKIIYLSNKKVRIFLYYFDYYYFC